MPPNARCASQRRSCVRSNDHDAGMIEQQQTFGLPRYVAVIPGAPGFHPEKLQRALPVATDSYRGNLEVFSSKLVLQSVPATPRGPSRKPKQSGFALWVGNLPTDTTIIELKDYMSTKSTKDIESVFLIFKSQCAFANYRTSLACEAAKIQFHGSRFRGKRLVCKTRSLQDPLSPTLSPPQVPEATPKSPDADQGDKAGIAVTLRSEQSALHTNTLTGGESEPSQPNPELPDSPKLTRFKVPDRFFILKSLTVEDLMASEKNSTWQTQAHNEEVLNDAFQNTCNVYLIFSANKSGEFYGLARMKSATYNDEPPSSCDSPIAFDEAPSPGSPRSIFSPATSTAPRGWIYDDSARNTIFWEAEDSKLPAGDVRRAPGNCPRQAQKQFDIEWLTTSRLSFYHTRGLRNPWNNHKDVKVARDGTELEPRVGQCLANLLIKRKDQTLAPRQLSDRRGP